MTDKKYPRRKCVVCDTYTEYACSDCAIDGRGTVGHCRSPMCEASHDAEFHPPPPEDYSVEDTVALLQADVNALWRVVKECCELLRVTEDDENDWPKLPVYVQALLARAEKSEN